MTSIHPARSNQQLCNGYAGVVGAFLGTMVIALTGFARNIEAGAVTLDARAGEVPAIDRQRFTFKDDCTSYGGEAGHPCIIDTRSQEIAGKAGEWKEIRKSGHNI